MSFVKKRAQAISTQKLHAVEAKTPFCLITVLKPKMSDSRKREHHV
jgi:hypothetical protein